MRAQILDVKKTDKRFTAFWRKWTKNNKGRWVGIRPNSFVNREYLPYRFGEMVVIRGRGVDKALNEKGLDGYILEYPVDCLRLDKAAQAEYMIWKMK